MDIGLPGMNGIDATRRLKRMNRELPVVILTSYEHEYATEAFWAGASGYILKSCKPAQLVQAIRSTLQGASKPFSPTELLQKFQQLTSALQTAHS